MTDDDDLIDKFEIKRLLGLGTYALINKWRKLHGFPAPVRRDDGGKAGRGGHLWRKGDVTRWAASSETFLNYRPGRGGQKAARPRLKKKLPGKSLRIEVAPSPQVEPPVDKPRLPHRTPRLLLYRQLLRDHLHVRRRAWHEIGRRWSVHRKPA